MNLTFIVSAVSLALGFALGALLRRRGISGGGAARLVALATLIGGGLLLSLSAPEISGEISKRSWPVTTGVVRDTTRTGERAVLPLVVYTYEVSGSAYTDSTDLDVPGFGSRRYREQTASKVLASYLPGETVTVHYDPDNPSVSDLRPGLRWAPLMRFTVGAMLLIAFGSLAPVARWKGRRYS